MQNLQWLEQTERSFTVPIPVQAKPELQQQPAGPPTPMTAAQASAPGALLSDDPAVHREAQRALREMVRTLDTVVECRRNVDQMMERLLRETRRQRDLRRRQMIRKGLYVLPLIALMFWSHGHIPFVWWFFVFGGGAVAANDATNKSREAAHALSIADEPRAVGVLALALRESDGRESYVQMTAHAALLRLLPRVRASDAASIDSEQMGALLELAERVDPRMQIAILKALEQIGTDRAIPVVEHLTAFGSTEEVQRKAQECLPFLIERARRTHEQATLLRISSAPTSREGREHLLRPAAATQPTEPAEQLLRATEERPISR